MEYAFISNRKGESFPTVIIGGRVVGVYRIVGDVLQVHSRFPINSFVFDALCTFIRFSFVGRESCVNSVVAWPYDVDLWEYAEWPEDAITLNDIPPIYVSKGYTITVSNTLAHESTLVETSNIPELHTHLMILSQLQACKIGIWDYIRAMEKQGLKVVYGHSAAIRSELRALANSFFEQISDKDILDVLKKVWDEPF